MRLKTISKFVIGVLCGTLITISIYSIADNKNEQPVINSQTSDNAGIPVNEINNFAKVYSITKNYYVESVTDAKLIKGAINGMLTNLDPHSTYLDQEEYKQLTEMTSGAFAGLGIEVSKDKDTGIRVIAPIDGTPAYYSGIKSGDLIMKIDNHPVSGMSLDQAVKKMRGIAGTKVTLTIARKNELKPLFFTITRALIEIRSIKYTMIAPNYAYIRITNFQADTTSGLVNALDKIYSKNRNLKGLILDSRDNPGGLLQSAVGVSSAFLPQHSLIVSVNGRAPNSKQNYLAELKYYNLNESNIDIISNVPLVYKQLPMIVLINQGTASASEIVAGSLQDYKRAEIIGTKSFGKGSVQTVIPLTSDTAIKLTTALYYTPNGRSIQAEGIRPDIIVQSEYSDLYNSWDLSEAALDNHLNNPLNNDISKDKNTPIITPPKQISTQSELKAQLNERLKKSPKVVTKDGANIDLKNDFQLQWALNILEGKPIPQQNKKILQ